MTIWPVEEIDDSSVVFRRIHRQKLNRINRKLLLPTFFKNSPESDPDLSVDWNKYIAPQGVRDLIAREYRFQSNQFKNPLDFHVVEINVGAIRALKIDQKVLHSPKQAEPEVIGNPNNRAHSSILGDKTEEEIRLKLAGISRWALEPA